MNSTIVVQQFVSSTVVYNKYVYDNICQVYTSIHDYYIYCNTYIFDRCKADGSKYTDPNFDMKGKPKDYY